MARSFRVFQKKRGHRRTGSRTLGSLGESMFLALLLVFGCAGLGILIWTLLVPEWRVHHEFVPGTCVVRDTRLGFSRNEDGPVYRPEILLEYEVGDQTHRAWAYNVHTLRGGGYSADRQENEALLRQIGVGGQYSFWFDPNDPESAILVRGSDWWIWLTFLVPGAFILIGAGGLIYKAFGWGKSAERRSALVTKTTQLARTGTDTNKHQQPPPEYPGIPVTGKLTDSPGTRLRFRLPASQSPGGALVVWLLITVGWNAIVSVFAFLAIRRFFLGQPDWVLTCFTIPFVLVGIGFVVFFVRQLVLTTAIGPTLVEISAQPLSPGGCYDLFVQQTGRLKIARLDVLLVCQEAATFRHGTDTRTESRRVHERVLLSRENIGVARGAPFEAECRLDIPGSAMHSFKSGHNEITWKIVVTGDAEGWPEFERSFPLIVQPNPQPTGNA